MIKKIYVTGDLQARSDHPFHYKAREIHLDWERNNPLINNEETIYFSLGDITEDSKPHSKELALLVKHFEELKNPEKWILGGNHDLNEIKKSWSFDPLLELEGVKGFKRPEEVNIQGLSILMMPFYKKSVFKNFSPMKEYYEALEGKYDFVAFHFEDHTMDFGAGTSIDTRKIKGYRLGGHIHTGGENYLPSPVPNTKAELLPERYGLLIDIETKEVEKIVYPNNLTFVSIEEGQDIPPSALDDFPVVALTVNNVLDETKVRETYTNYENVYIRRLNKPSTINKEEIKKEGKVRTLLEYWKTFKEHRGVSEEVSKIIEESGIF